MPFTDAAGHRLEYEWLGPGPEEAATVVMLHEGLGSVAMWKDFPAALQAATGLGVLVYSRHGYGKSDPIERPRAIDYMHDEATTALPEVLTGLGVRDPIFLGHSDGGSIALIHAGSPGLPGPRPRAVVTEAAHVFVEDISVESIAKAKTAYETTDLPARLGRYHDHVDSAFWGWNDVWLHNDFRQWNIEAYLPRVTCPLLAIQGEDDQYGTIVQIEAIAAQAGGPVETVLIPGCGHSPHVEARAAALAPMVRFIGAVTGKEAAA